MILYAGLPEFEDEPAFLTALRDQHHELARVVKERRDALVALERGYSAEDYAVSQARARARRDGEAFDASSVPVTSVEERRREILRLAEREAEALRDLGTWGSRAVRGIRANRGELDEIERARRTAHGGSPQFIASFRVGELLRQVDSGAFETHIAEVAEQARHLVKTGTYA